MASFWTFFGLYDGAVRCNTCNKEQTANSLTHHESDCKDATAATNWYHSQLKSPGKEPLFQWKVFEVTGGGTEVEKETVELSAIPTSADVFDAIGVSSEDFSFSFETDIHTAVITISSGNEIYFRLRRVS